jgi:phage tail sheath protein FI
MPYKQSENALAGGAIASGETLTVTYTYADPTKVASADVIGTTDGSGHRTGLQAFLDCFQMFGFFPKRLIAPVYSPLASVTAALIAMANRIRGRAYIDAPVGLTPAQAIAGRGPRAGGRNQLQRQRQPRGAVLPLREGPRRHRRRPAGAHEPARGGPR